MKILYEYEVKKMNNIEKLLKLMTMPYMNRIPTKKKTRYKNIVSLKM